MRNETQQLIGSLIQVETIQTPNVFCEKSQLWKGMLSERKEEYTSEIFENILNPNSDQTSGTSDWRREVSDYLIQYFESFIKPSMIEKYPMPSTGSPSVFKLFDYDVATAYLWNLSRFSLCKEMLNGKIDDKKLDFVEIGAGYGAAALMWVQTGLIRSYTIVDLSENILNSAYYLSENLKEWKINVCRNHVLDNSPNTINLVLPGLIEKIDSLSFDVAINSDSLGEMPEDTCKAYVEWIYQHLKHNGLFFSKNGHRRGTSHVEKVSDYGYQKYTLVDFRSSKVCSSLFDDFSHVILLQKTGQSMTSEQVTTIETISNLFSIGLLQDIERICTMFINNKLGEEEIFFLSECKKYFNGEESIQVQGSYSYLLKYCIAIREAAEKKRYNSGLVEYLSTGASYIAKVYCILFLLYFKKSPELSNNHHGAGFTLYVQDIVPFEKYGFLNRWLRYRIRFDCIRKKTTPYKKWKPSFIVRLKNLLFNILEGRFVRPIK